MKLESHNIYYNLFYETNDGRIICRPIVANDILNARFKLIDKQRDTELQYGCTVINFWVEESDTIYLGEDDKLYLVLSPEEFDKLSPEIGSRIKVTFRKYDEYRTITYMKKHENYYYLRIEN
jgi:hypothetical protein